MTTDAVFMAEKASVTSKVTIWNSLEDKLGDEAREEGYEPLFFQRTEFTGKDSDGTVAGYGYQVTCFAEKEAE